MGYRNVDAAFRLYSQPLADRQPAFRVLVYMALRSQDVDTDEQDARIYFAGHEALAVEGLGLETFDRAAKQAVGRAIKALASASIIEQTVAAYRGRNAEYRLNLDAAESPVESSDTLMGITQRYPLGQGEPGNGIRPATPFPVDNSGMGIAQRYPSGTRMGITQRAEWVSPSESNGYHSAIPLQEDKKYKTSPYPHADDSSGLPVDNSEGEEQSNQAAAEPPVMATDYATRLKAEVSSRNGNVSSATASADPDHFNRSVKATANNFAGSPKVSPPPSTEAARRSPGNHGQGLSAKNVQKGVRRVDTPDQVPAADQAAIELLTADGTDLALASDMLALAKRDPETKAAHARIRHPKYREQLRSAVISERNRQHSAAAKAAGPCPHGELGGLVPTRAGTPTCVSCRAETRHHRETA